MVRCAAGGRKIKFPKNETFNVYIRISSARWEKKSVRAARKIIAKAFRGKELQNLDFAKISTSLRGEKKEGGAVLGAAGLAWRPWKCVVPSGTEVSSWTAIHGRFPDEAVIVGATSTPRLVLDGHSWPFPPQAVIGPCFSTGRAVAPTEAQPATARRRRRRAVAGWAREEKRCLHCVCPC